MRSGLAVGWMRVSVLALSAVVLQLPLSASPVQVSPSAVKSEQQTTLSVRGTVFDAARKPVSDALVTLLDSARATKLVMKTDATGSFLFTSLPVGRYTVSAIGGGAASAADFVTLATGDTPKLIELVLRPPAAPEQAMEFADKPNFTVAGVTDWTAVGGHGSDASLRTSEDLARETLTLKAEQGPSPAESSQQHEVEKRLRAARDSNPKSFEANDQLGHFYVTNRRYQDAIAPLRAAYDVEPTNRANTFDLAQAYEGAGDYASAQAEIKKLLAQKDTAELHRLTGEIDEKLGDPLAAVQQDELAVRMDPSEPNYFEWGSELLQHRAVRQAVDVFRIGSKAHPASARMLAGLGAALFASAAYDEAALRLCDASDLDPDAQQPYLFLGKVEIAAPSPLPCVETKLGRFLKLRPDDPQANYLYAMALWKRQEVAGHTKDPLVTKQVEALLSKASALDNKCFDAYLQLGVIHFEQRDYRAAADAYTKAIAADPELGEAHYRLGVAYDRLGEHEKAQQEFQLHSDIEKEQAAAVERQRRDVKQFEIVLDAKPAQATQ